MEFRMELTRWRTCLLAFFVSYPVSKFSGEAFQPEFTEPLQNLTVSLGRDAIFKCMVQNLGGYRVGWVKADTKAIQAIHIHVITYNPRVSVSHAGPNRWNLHIKNVQEEDKGYYMCQINTDPMKSQIGFLNVVVPPDFISHETSGDVIIIEGGTTKLTCRAHGIPTPKVQWRKEDGSDIVIRDPIGTKMKVQVYEGEELILHKVSRNEMGAYLCIASNGIPPTVSKRISVQVHFHPVIQVPNQLVGAPLGTDVTLECYVESSPKSINYWVRDSNEMVISSNKYQVVNTAVSSFESRMLLTVHKLRAEDLGGYKCVAKNSLGEVDSVIRLYEIPGPETKEPPLSITNQIPKHTNQDIFVTSAGETLDASSYDTNLDSKELTRMINVVVKNSKEYIDDNVGNNNLVYINRASNECINSLFVIFMVVVYNIVQ